MSIKNRVMRVTRKPKTGSLLAAQILDPLYFQDLFRFCDNLAHLIAKHYRIQCSPDSVECAARYWADSAGIESQGKFEGLVYEALDTFCPVFKGWSKSKVIEDVSDTPNDSVEDQISL